MTGFTIADALHHLLAAKADYTRLIEQKTFDVGIYRPLRVDPQTPHSRDELYVVASGRGEFICAGETKAFGHGDPFFVPARSTPISRKRSLAARRRPSQRIPAPEGTCIIGCKFSPVL